MGGDANGCDVCYSVGKSSTRSFYTHHNFLKGMDTLSVGVLSFFFYGGQG